LSVDQFNVDYVLYGLIGGAVALALASRPATRRTYPLLATLALTLASPPLRMPATIVAATIVASAAAGWGTQRLASLDSAIVLAGYGLVTLGGLWLAVPDTEAVLVAVGVVAPAAALAVARRPAVADLLGWPLLALTIMVVAASSSAEDLSVAIGAFGCLGLVAVAPLVGLAERRALLTLEGGRARPAAALVVHGAIAVICARVATEVDGAPAAFAVVAGCWLAGAAVVWAMARTINQPQPS
jgi:hypothetical protein